MEEIENKEQYDKFKTNHINNHFKFKLTLHTSIIKLDKKYKIQLCISNKKSMSNIKIQRG